METKQQRASRLGVETSMLLPEGMRCRDCRSFRSCKAFIGISGDEAHCDWSPSRFALAPPEPEGGAARSGEACPSPDRQPPSREPGEGKP